MAVREGTRSARPQVIKTQFGGNDIRKIRCPHDQGMAVAVPDGKGGNKYQCHTCKREFQSRSIDG